jgi:GAF domain-containing protein
MSKLEFSPQIVEALQKLSSLLESDDGLGQTLAVVIELSVATIPGCDSAGVTIRVDGKDMTAAASDDYTLEIDKIQYDTGEGPCVTALRLGEPLQIRAISEETRWPEFCRRAKEKGFGSGSSYPLKMNGSTGALNLYSLHERAFDEASVELGAIFARQASTALHNAVT